MKKLAALMVIYICLMVALAGCDHESGVPLNDLKPMIMIDGELYLDTGVEENGTAPPQTAAGEILSTVPQTEKPAENGQSNFGAVEEPYYFDGEDLIVRINHQWFKFERDGAN